VELPEQHALFREFVEAASRYGSGTDTRLRPAA
jgi:hypothetical protein